jgi:D-cysteine desulfhydrase
LGVDVFVKSEEECGAWGGNKVRKLEYLLADARASGVELLTSWGVGTSNWTSALALHGALQDFRVRLYLWGEPPAHYAELYRALGTEVIPIGQLRLSYGMAAGLLKPRRGTELVLPPGGSGRIGDLGSVHAGEEIAAAVEAGDLPRPAKVFVALGTCGTSAGVAAGMTALGLDAPTVAVKVAALPYGNVALARERARRFLRRAGCGDRPTIESDARFFAPGYAQPNPASIEAQQIARLDGYETDGTYAAKAFASLVSHARDHKRGPLLFVLTSPGPPPTDPL